MYCNSKTFIGLNRLKVWKFMNSRTESSLVKQKCPGEKNDIKKGMPAARQRDTAHLVCLGKGSEWVGLSWCLTTSSWAQHVESLPPGFSFLPSQQSPVSASRDGGHWLPSAVVGWKCGLSFSSCLSHTFLWQAGCYLKFSLNNRRATLCSLPLWIWLFIYILC